VTAEQITMNGSWRYLIFQLDQEDYLIEWILWKVSSNC